MPKAVTEYRCLLISPSDVRQERDSLTDLVNRWNAQIGQALGARVELVRWESHASPDMSGPPQGIINSQLLEDCDFAIAIFWTRLGTPTAEYESGSVEEIYRLIERGARVLIYFNTSPIPQESLSNDQFQRLQEIKKRFDKEGLLGSYGDISNLREQVHLHLTSIVSELLSKDLASSGSLPRSDVKVKANIGFVSDSNNELQKILNISVENHSPLPFFMGNINLKLKDGQLFFVPKDFVTGEFQARRKLHPGESFAFHIKPDVISRKVDPRDLVCVTVTDDINRVYESPESDFQLLIHVLFDDDAVHQQ
jgi:hypothetical protein